MEQEKRGLRLSAGDTVDMFQVEATTPTRLRLASGMTAAIFLIVLAVLAILFDLWLLRVGFHPRILRIFPKVIQVLLVFTPLFAIAGLFFIGRGYDVDASRDLIEARRMYILRTTHPASQVANVVLDIQTPGRSSLMTVRLKDRDNKDLLSLFFTALDGPDWPKVLHAAAEISRILNRPLRIEGDPNQAMPNAVAAIEEIRRTGQPPAEMRAYG
jgi:hypothetical protein